jgi:outer membrane PBP1 activator LpoA protein
LQPAGGDALQTEGYLPVHHIALLLPLNAQYASVAQSVRDGFMTAYFSDARERRPELRIYDSGKNPADAVAAYNQAVADGADHVIGPLQRESVGELFHQPLKIPVLALNHPDTGEVPPPGSAEFGLLPDAEGAQVAERMRARGIARAAIFAATADWAERAARAFRAQFEAAGGVVVGETRLADKDVNFSTSILQATGALGDGADGGVFISMRPQQARLLLPQLMIANVHSPVYATSHVYAGDTNAALDRDLDGVEFCDVPWLFGPVPGRPNRDAVAARIDSANGLGSRLFAFGMDAYALLPYMDWLLAHPDSYLNGATGELTADGFGRIHRLVGWARFRNGVALPIDGALDSAPLQQ